MQQTTITQINWKNPKGECIKIPHSFSSKFPYEPKWPKWKKDCDSVEISVQNFMFYSSVFILFNRKGKGFSKTETFMLCQTSDFVGSCAIFSTISMSSGRTEPNTVYAPRHSSWLARLIKNSGPEPTQATDPLLIVGQSSFGFFLNMVPCASRVPWIRAKGGP